MSIFYTNEKKKDKDADRSINTLTPIIKEFKFYFNCTLIRSFRLQDNTVVDEYKKNDKSFLIIYTHLYPFLIFCQENKLDDFDQLEQYAILYELSKE